ncbi:MAG TPA: VanZ family protein [Methylomirabilota bacterium]|jgi:VanZ family protein|nr:VanZ family protein [Methylomirabilota bacterium]
MRLASSLAWTGLVLFLGSVYFGADHTGVLLQPLFRALAPLVGVSPHTLHALVRKAAHVTEYAVLAGLWFYALSERRSAMRASWIALLICLACAVADETHQAMVPNRTPSARDVVIDGTGALMALSVVRRRRERLEARALPYAAA